MFKWFKSLFKKQGIQSFCKECGKTRYFMIIPGTRETQCIPWQHYKSSYELMDELDK